MKRLLALIAPLLAFVCPSLAQDYPDGIYRGFYYDGGIEQIAIQFELKDGIFTSLIYRGVKYKDGDYMNEDASDAQKAILHQYRQLAEYLVGKDISAIDDLYSPYDIVEDLDAVTTATMKAGKLISALWDGLNRHPYKIVDTTKLPEAESYSDGVYRGSYMEDGGEQVALEFTLKDNHFTEINYLTLQYKDEDYLSSDAATAQGKICTQFKQLLDYLVGKDVSSVNRLYLPGQIASDPECSPGPTLRAPKVISAIWDALGRHAYTIIK